METQNRPHAAAIKSLKERIKTLAARQRPLKLLRKTSISEEHRSLLLAMTGMTEAWKGLDPQALSYSAWSFVNGRKTEITAAINLYHELRGSEHRHGGDGDWCYERALAALRKELAL